MVNESDDFNEYEPVLAHEVCDEKYGQYQSHDFHKVANINLLSYENSVFIDFLAFYWVIQGVALSGLNIKVYEGLKESDAHVKLQVLDSDGL